jgi:predicted thioredoxin/glutaredoxin
MWGANVAGANEYNKAVIGHVIKEKVTGGNIDTSKLMENELQKLAHQFTIESIVILQKYLPSILDGIAADLRLKADKEYKCKLLKGSPNGCKE